MNNLSDIKNHENIIKYFKEELELDEEELNRRVQLYLEVFPFIAMDFRLKSDCSSVHKTMNIKNNKVLSSKNASPSLQQKLLNYNNALLELRKELEFSEVEININE